MAPRHACPPNLLAQTVSVTRGKCFEKVHVGHSAADRGEHRQARTGPETWALLPNKGNHKGCGGYYGETGEEGDQFLWDRNHHGFR
jgi:hypothetical protein